MTSDSQTEFEELKTRIYLQAVGEKHASQYRNGLRKQQECERAGRCSYCTLVPPCKHFNEAVQIDNDSQFMELAKKSNSPFRGKQII